MAKFKKLALLCTSLMLTLGLGVATGCSGDDDSSSSVKSSSETTSSVPDSSVADSSEPDSSVADSSEPDSSVADSSEPDSSVADSSVPDSSEPDSSVPDSSVADSSVPDSSVPDSSEPDSSVPDSSEPDSSVADSSEPDSSEPDSSVPDSSEPDSSEPDSSVPDSSEPDSSEPDSSVPNSSDSSTSSDDSSSSDEIVVGDNDLVEELTFYDRLNQKVMKADDSIKNNQNNYWDGSVDCVEVVKQSDFTNGSNWAMKVSFNPTLITEEQAQLASVSYGGDWASDRVMWVGYKIPVGADIDLSNFRLTIDMKFVNMSSAVTAYAVSNGVVGDYAYEHGAEMSFTGEELSDGWYRYYITFDVESNATTEAEYIVLSLDNSAFDKTQASIAYIDNAVLEEVSFVNVKLDGVAQRVEVGTEFNVEAPTKPGCEFLGWKNASGELVELPFTVTEDVSLTSVWKKIPVAVAIGQETAVDIYDLPMEYTYERYTFEAEAETKYVVTGLTGGILLYQLVDPSDDLGTDANYGDAIAVDTEFYFEEATTVIFAVTFNWDASEDIFGRGSFTIIKIHNPKIPADAEEVSDTAFGNAWRAPKTAGDISAPLGFESVVKHTADTSRKPWNNNMGAESFNNVDLSDYSEVWFAMKFVNAQLQIDYDPNMKYADADWVYFHLIKTAGNVWTIEMTHEGNTTTYENQTGADISGSSSGYAYVANSLNAILYGGLYSGDLKDSHGMRLYWVADTTPVIYSTNVMAVKCTHEGVEATFVSNGDGTHSKVYACCGAVEGEAEACTMADGATATCSTPSACTVCNGDVYDATNHESEDTQCVSKGDNTHDWKYVCCSAVKANEACSGGTATATEKAVCDVCGTAYGSLLYNPNVSEDAVQVTDTAFGNAWRAPKGESDISAPEGFTSVVKHTAMTDRWPYNNNMGTESFNGVDLSAYSEVWFAMKFVNAQIQINYNANTSYADWVYFHLTQTADNVWTIEMTYDGATTTYENQTGLDVASTSSTANTLITILYGGYYGTPTVSDSMGMRIYWVADTTPVIYSTEVKGVAKTVVEE